MEKQTLINQLIERYKNNLNKFTNWLKGFNAEKLTKGVKRGGSVLLSTGLIASMLMTTGCDLTNLPVVDSGNEITTNQDKEVGEFDLQAQLSQNYDPNYKCDFTSDLGIKLAQTKMYKSASKVSERELRAIGLAHTPSKFFKDMGISDENINYNTGIRGVLVTNNALYIMTYATNKVLKEAPDYSLFSLIKYDNLPAELTQDLVKAQLEKKYLKINGLINAISITYTPEVIAESYVDVATGGGYYTGKGEGFSVMGNGLVVSDGDTKTIYIMGIDENEQPVITISKNTKLTKLEQAKVSVLDSNINYVRQAGTGWAEQDNHEIVDTGIENGYMNYPNNNVYVEPVNNLEQNS